MIRSEVFATFRVENPEIKDRVVTDAQLAVWCKQANIDFCTKARCINGEISFTAAVDDTHWDLSSKEPKFFDINEYPGGGVCIDGERINKDSKAGFDYTQKDWRANTSGTPDSYFRYGKFIYVNKPLSTAWDIIVDAILLPDAWTTDVAPFNELGYLEPYHYAIVRYLAWKALKEKPQEQANALAEFEAMAKACRRSLATGRQAETFIHGPSMPSNGYGI